MQEGLLARMREVEETHWWLRARRELLLATLRKWVPRGKRILDVGCGTGFLAEAAAGDWEVWGLDTSPEAVAFCRQRGLEHVKLGSVTDLGTGLFPPCDAVCFFDVLEHLESDLVALRGAVVNLSPGGLVIATVPAYPWLWSPHDDAHHHKRRYTGETLRRAFESAGLSVAQIGYFNSRLFPLALVVRLWSRIMRRRSSEVLLPIPPKPVNNFLRAVFGSEVGRLAGNDDRLFGFGLSVLGVGRKAGPELRAEGMEANPA